MKKFEELEHTADLGLRVYGTTLANLLANAAEGMFGLIGNGQFNASQMRSLTVAIRVAGEPGERSPARPNEELLYQWLKRLLREFNLHSFFPVKFEVEVTADGCQGRLEGGTFDPAVHTFHTEIKGVTLHGLKVAKMNSGWQAEIIFDV